MNELVLTQVNPVVTGVEELALEVEKSISLIGLIVPTAENVELCSKEVSKFNKMFDEADSAVVGIMNKWDEPLMSKIKPLQDKLDLFENAKKDYQAKVLIAKKENYKNEAYKVFLDFAKLSVDGNIPNYDEFYEDNWYGETKDQLRNSIAVKFAAFAQKEEPDDPNAFAIFTIKGSHQIARAEKLLHDSGVQFSKEGN